MQWKLLSIEQLNSVKYCQKNMLFLFWVNTTSRREIVGRREQKHHKFSELQTRELKPGTESVVTIWYYQHLRRSVLEVGLTFFYGMCGPRLTIRDHSKDWEAARGRPRPNPPPLLCCPQKITMTTAPTWYGQPTPFSFSFFLWIL